MRNRESSRERDPERPESYAAFSANTRRTTADCILRSRTCVPFSLYDISPFAQAANVDLSLSAAFKPAIMRPRPAPTAAALSAARPKADAARDLRAVATPQGLAAALVALAAAFAARGRILEYMAVLRARDRGLPRWERAARSCGWKLGQGAQCIPPHLLR